MIYTLAHPFSLRSNIFGRVIAIKALDIYERHLEILYIIDNQFHSLTRIYYPKGELGILTQLYPESLLKSLYAHIALFEGLKYCITFPEKFDISLIASDLSEASLELFQTILFQSWSQHCYENNKAEYIGPKLLYNTVLQQQTPRFIPQKTDKSTHLLCANGGGKDSFLVMKILEKAKIPYSVFQHARSEYGRFDYQHELQRRILHHLPNHQQIHEISILDDYTDGVLASVYHSDLIGECLKGHPCQVGWPEMIFEALPIVLAYGYQGFVLGNERSADANQVSWENRCINHQWIKSDQACRLINQYLQENLIANFNVFSLLKPIHDQRIYHLLSSYPEILPDIHSCNIVKPWCKKCAKCAYVWLNLVAVFGFERVKTIFGSNLFDDVALENYWYELLGLSQHNSFECVGEIAETRLAFYRCYQRGYQGWAMNVFKEHFIDNSNFTIDWDHLSKQYNTIYSEHIIPTAIYEKIKLYL